jgi:hypothetical protein
MSDWNEQIPKCFRPADLVFASTPEERARAEELRREIRRESICPGLLESAIEDWLHAECSNTGHLFEQMTLVRSFFEDQSSDDRPPPAG